MEWSPRRFPQVKGCNDPIIQGISLVEENQEKPYARLDAHCDAIPIWLPSLAPEPSIHNLEAHVPSVLGLRC
jgi:hypothetical protein